MVHMFVIDSLFFCVFYCNAKVVLNASGWSGFRYRVFVTGFSYWVSVELHGTRERYVTGFPTK